MSVVGKILATVADRYGTGVVFLARRPEVYERPLFRAGVDLADITPAAVSHGAAYEREWETRIFERIRVYNEKIQSRNTAVGDNCNGGEKNTNQENIVKIKRSAVIELFLAMDFGSAPKWDDAKLAVKIKELPVLAADEPPPADESHKKLLGKLIKAAKAGEKVEYETEAPPAASPSGSPSGSPSASPASGSPSDPSGSPSDPSGSPSGSPASASPSGSPSGSPSKSPAPAPKETKKPAEEFVGMVALITILTRIALSLEGVMAVIMKADAPQPGPEKPPKEKPAPANGDTKADSLTALNQLIFEIMEAASSDKKGLKSSELLAKLQATFPKRDKRWLDEKMRKQLGGVLESKYGLKVKKSRDGKYYTVRAEK